MDMCCQINSHGYDLHTSLVPASGAPNKMSAGAGRDTGGGAPTRRGSDPKEEEYVIRHVEGVFDNQGSMNSTPTAAFERYLANDI